MAKKISGNPSKVSSKSKSLPPKRRSGLPKRLPSEVQMAFIFLISLVVNALVLVVVLCCRSTGMRLEVLSIAALALNLMRILRDMATHLFPSQKNGG